MKRRAAFIGLTTWDLLYVVEHMPSNDEKIVALDAAMNAGGPATNAAVTFAALGGQPLLVSPVGSGPLGRAITRDLTGNGVRHHDIAPVDAFTPPVSSALVTRGTGHRAVVSLNGSKISHTARWEPQQVLSGCDLLLVDGHYMDAALSAAAWARTAGVPVVLDGGSWKEGTERLLGLCDIVISSARFRPPACASTEEVFAYLAAAGVTHAAITDGDRPVRLREGTTIDALPVHVSQGIDTTGAGDVFHGAFCHYFLAGRGFRASLGEASRMAALKCDHLGARSWLATLGR